MSMLTMKAIMKTFGEMVEEMPFEKITVLALTKRCEISHNTFYYHFRDIYELLDAWLDCEKNKLLEELDDSMDWKKELEAMFKACKDHPKIVNHILSSLSKERIEYYLFSRTEDLFTKIVRERAEAAGKGLEDLQINEIAEFCRYAFAGYFLKFNYVYPTPDVDEYIEHFEGLFDIFVKNAIDM